MSSHLPRLALFFNARRSQGGLFQYASEVYEALQQTDNGDTFEVRVFDASFSSLRFTPKPGWAIEAISRRSLVLNMLVEILVMHLAKRGLKKLPSRLPRLSQVTRFRPDLVFYLKPDLRVGMWPYRSIAPIHDLQHRLQPEFPEVSDSGESRRRDYMFSSIVAKASAILCDSEVGKEDILSVYGGSPDKIHALPYFAPSYIYTRPDTDEQTRLSVKYQLPEKFFFYPAAFWRHKNHVLIVRALAIIKRNCGDSPNVVFAGSKTREYESIFHLAQELGVEGRIHFIGYVPDEDMAGLYRCAEALVMPTFFGPTNIPVIEAWACGCPVITSDLRGIREQVVDTGILVDPKEPTSLADAMMRIHGDEEFRRSLSEKGMRREASWRAVDYGRAVWKILAGIGHDRVGSNNQPS